jgi:hypothetical protein
MTMILMSGKIYEELGGAEQPFTDGGLLRRMQIDAEAVVIVDMRNETLMLLNNTQAVILGFYNLIG